MRRTSAVSLVSLLSLAVLLPACECADPDRGRRDTGNGEGDTSTTGDAPLGDTGPIDPCGDGLDGDMDGRVDEGCACSPGETQHCYSGDPALAGIGGCLWGAQECATDFELGVWAECIGDGAPVTEICDGVDNDCDGTVDEGCECRPEETRVCYSGTPGTETMGACEAGIERCVITGDGSMWGPCEGETVPSDELCDGVLDEDCDGVVDDGCTCVDGTSRACYGGSASTRGVGACRDGSQSCSASGWSTCSGEVRPRSEVCTGGLDEDCDGLVDCADPDCGALCCSPYDTSVPVVPAEGDILFVIDRSGSMDWPAVDTSRTRWQELMSATSSVLPMVGSLPMGLLTFPLLTGTSESLNCMVASSPEIAIASGTGSAISARLVAADPRAGDTPTPQAFSTVSSYLMGLPATSRTRFVVLATDGLPEPNCGSTVPATVTAISSLRSAGIDTFVIGIVGPSNTGDTSGIPALRDALNQFAVAGGRPRGGSIRYYEAGDGAALTSSFRAVLAAATDCSFELASAPPRPGALEIRLNGTLISPSLWTVTGTRLDLAGSACDQVQAGLVMTIRASDTCS